MGQLFIASGAQAAGGRRERREIRASRAGVSSAGRVSGTRSAQAAWEQLRASSARAARESRFLGNTTLGGSAGRLERRGASLCKPCASAARERRAPRLCGAHEASERRVSGERAPRVVVPRLGDSWILLGTARTLPCLDERLPSDFTTRFFGERPPTVPDGEPSNTLQSHRHHQLKLRQRALAFTST